jgi:hypothetical protein
LTKHTRFLTSACPLTTRLPQPPSILPPHMPHPHALSPAISCYTNPYPPCPVLSTSLPVHLSCKAPCPQQRGHCFLYSAPVTVRSTCAPASALENHSITNIKLPPDIHTSVGHDMDAQPRAARMHANRMRCSEEDAHLRAPSITDPRTASVPVLAMV